MQAAKRELHAECGPNMNTWVVGRRPIGLFEDAQDLAEKVCLSLSKIASRLMVFRVAILL